MKLKAYKTVILLVVLYGCETWYVTLREERLPRTFENRLLRKVLESKMEKVKGRGWRN
jgi:hypothetical protein